MSTPPDGTLTLAVLGGGALLLVHGLFAVALIVWARAVARRQHGAWWRFARRLPLLGLGLTVAGLLVTVALLVGSFRAVGHAAAADRAKLLSEGINAAMIATSICVPLAWLAWVASLVSNVVGSVKAPSPR